MSVLTPGPPFLPPPDYVRLALPGGLFRPLYHRALPPSAGAGRRAPEQKPWDQRGVPDGPRLRNAERDQMVPPAPRVQCIRPSRGQKIPPRQGAWRRGDSGWPDEGHRVLAGNTWPSTPASPPQPHLRGIPGRGGRGQRPRPPYIAPPPWGPPAPEFTATQLPPVKPWPHPGGGSTTEARPRSPSGTAVYTFTGPGRPGSGRKGPRSYHGGGRAFGGGLTTAPHSPTELVASSTPRKCPAPPGEATVEYTPTPRTGLRPSKSRSQGQREVITPILGS
ncbi:hypothetical protein GWK47_029391 [Chionoecetes opilio]|uniref:Uncharacterized protein n=1 Tax=Chionoecetes opilio TaxID=41210 RepID=A0A8J4YKN7_CHIOP|nr:hypothetical protein GWK47_029391 [Chionoecetes opilio]